jgi:hypothetical protein
MKCPEYANHERERLVVSRAKESLEKGRMRCHYKWI